MIDSIDICDAATFCGNHSLNDLREFNFLYGANAVGKTTISKVIANEAAYPKCKIKWKNGDKLQTLVYNRNFVDASFSQLTEMKGIFTLGEQNVELVARIAKVKEEHDKLSNKVNALRIQLQGETGDGGERKKLTNLDDLLCDQCWDVKKKYDKDFKPVFEGTNKEKDKFKCRALRELTSNKTKAIPIEDLRKKVTTLFGEVQAGIPPLSSVDFTKLVSFEAYKILSKKIIGKGDVDISAMIDKLGNSDWVKQGRDFYDKNSGICPFCQQGTSASLKKSLEDYFDKSFEDDAIAIQTLERDYKGASSTIQASLQTLINNKSKYLNMELFEKEKELFDAAVSKNLTRIAEKKKEPSVVVNLVSVAEVGKRIVAMIEAANNVIEERNTTVANRESERKKLTDGVWRLLLDGELKTVLDNYLKRKAEIQAAITSITKQIDDSMLLLGKKKVELQGLEKSITSIQPTVDAINSLLKSFCFMSFSLVVASELTYKLVRSNGDSAKETLSEAEKTFITFLYFYHLLKGSESATGVFTNRVVVFDDPVSSLDSDVLHIVSCLIKSLFDDIRAKKGHIKQIFVLTHNVYFHKEVTYNNKRRDVAMREESFWVVRKRGECSTVEKIGKNPVNTSYELLWAEIGRQDLSKHTIQNSLRRVLESSFNILGKNKLKKMHEQFTGRDREICRCLLSWINDGSHLAHDDLFVAVEDKVIEIYLQVFRSIFDKAGFIDHYNMMMGIAPEPKHSATETLQMAGAAKAS